MNVITEKLPPKHPCERHLAAAVCCDCSGSMYGDPIKQLNEAMKFFGRELAKDSYSQGRIDVTVISFASSARTEMGFRSAEDYQAPSFNASGMTAMNTAINLALDSLEARKKEYKQSHINYYRPWLFVFSDGLPTDDDLTAETQKRLQEYISRKKVLYIPMAIGDNADIACLQSYYPKNTENKLVLKCHPNALKDAFLWLSTSMSAASSSNPQLGTIQSPQLPNTITIAL